MAKLHRNAKAGALDIPRRAGGRGERVGEDGVDAGRLLLRVLLIEVGAGGGSIQLWTASTS